MSGPVNLWFYVPRLWCFSNPSSRESFKCQYHVSHVTSIVPGSGRGCSPGCKIWFLCHGYKPGTSLPLPDVYKFHQDGLFDFYTYLKWLLKVPMWPIAILVGQLWLLMCYVRTMLLWNFDIFILMWPKYPSSVYCIGIRVFPVSSNNWPTGHSTLTHLAHVFLTYTLPPFQTGLGLGWKSLPLAAGFMAGKCLLHKMPLVQSHDHCPSPGPSDNLLVIRRTNNFY